MDSNCQPKNEKQKEPFIHSVYDFVELFVIAVCVVFIIFSFAFRLCRVNGESMEKTLYDGQLLLISDLFYQPEQGDIIVFHQTSETPNGLNELVVKRVIATEGQFVKIEKNAVYVSDDDVFDENDRLSESEYAYMESGYMWDSYHLHGEVLEVPQGSLFVMGDNRNNSADSRDSRIGFVDSRRVVGKVLLRIFPLDQLGIVK